MAHKFYFKFVLFCLMLFLCALIIDAKRNVFHLAIYVSDEMTILNDTSKSEYLIYVSNFNHTIFPLNIITSKPKNFKMSYYDTQIKNGLDDQIYMKFSLLTNYSNYLPMGVKTEIPPSTKLVGYNLENEILTLTVSEDFLNYNKANEEELLKILTFTFTSIDGIKTVKLVSEDNDIQFEHYFRDTFQKDDFILNVYFQTTNINDSTKYNLYYLTGINDNYYLVPTTVIVETNELSEKENISLLLTKTFNIPLISFVDTNNIEEIVNSDIFQEKLPYYQYYLTCFENNIINKNYSIDIKDINFYEIVFE